MTFSGGGGVVDLVGIDFECDAAGGDGNAVDAVAAVALVRRAMIARNHRDSELPLLRV